ncbi:MAG TPA: alpha/beta fold hydrolase [Candidatus Saccharimonadia bacterium]|nr:alpha/beta fold hydrolase [Candidatus Saccharimonadia bacterium]
MAEEATQITGAGAVAFDFSGHGQSTGRLSQSSLHKRVDEAETVWSLLARDRPIGLFGFSMGGHIALELLARHPVVSLVLLYPGIYTHQAYDAPFDRRFTTMIQQSGSWHQAAVLKALRDFTGRLLIVYGSNDRVVPRGVVDEIYAAASQAVQRELWVIPEAPHLLLPFMLERPDLWRQLKLKLTDCLTTVKE